MIQYSNCPVCASTDFKEVMRAKDYTVSGKIFGISHCNSCQHRFTNPVPGQDEIGPYYKSENYVSHTNTSKGIIFRLYQMVRKRTLRSKKKLVSTETSLEKGKHLDIGSGAGAFLATMKNAGWDSLGLEPDPDARQVAEKDFAVVAKPIEHLFELPDNTMDAITMWHVLEHVHELDAYMKKLRSLIKDSGRIFIAVPNYTSKDAQHYQEKWAAYDVPRHLYHFCPDSMRRLLEINGLKLLKIKRMPYDSFYVSMLTERNIGKSVIKGAWHGLMSFFAAMGNEERCSSVIYVISK
jgi:2-polyprenyl-3-methyl-5-hydroxy-6-metoxy-1,4-benzoquinol methylase